MKHWEPLAMALFLIVVAGGCVWALFQPIQQPEIRGSGTWTQKKDSMRALNEFQQSPRWYAFKHRAMLVLGIVLSSSAAAWCVRLAFVE